MTNDELILSHEKNYNEVNTMFQIFKEKFNDISNPDNDKYCDYLEMMETRLENMNTAVVQLSVNLA